MNFYFDVIVLMLAAGRLTYSIPHDDIWQPLRHKLYLWSPPDETDEAGRPYRLWKKYRKDFHYFDVDTADFVEDGDYGYSIHWSPRPRGWLGSLASCIYCVSIYVGSFMVVGYALFGHSFALAMLPFAAWYAANALAKGLS